MIDRKQKVKADDESTTMSQDWPISEQSQKGRENHVRASEHTQMFDGYGRERKVVHFWKRELLVEFKCSVPNCKEE